MRYALAIVGMLAAAGAVAIANPLCGIEKTCPQMRTCAEAHFYLTICGHSRRDADGDGIPCENVCGESRETMEARMAAEPFGFAASTTSLTPSPPAPAADRARAPSESNGFSCGAKRTCKEMTSCEEARFHLTVCGNARLDGDRDGVPCNALCR